MPAIQPYSGSFVTPSFERAIIADAMHPGIVSCAADANLTEVSRIMASHHVHCVAVMTQGQDHSGAPYVWGIVSDFDVMRAAGNGDLHATAGTVAQQPVISVKPTVSLVSATELMLENRVSHLVVIDADSLLPIGILSTLDIAGVLAWGEA
jgi:CBS domain-containing protein